MSGKDIQGLNITGDFSKRNHLKIGKIIWYKIKAERFIMFNWYLWVFYIKQKDLVGHKLIVCGGFSLERSTI